MNVNKAFVLGNLTRDPDLRAMTDGTPIASFAIATNMHRRGSDKTETEFHNIIVYGKKAEDCYKYLKKGSLAHVDGRIQTRTSERDGVKQSRTYIIAEKVQFGPRPNAVNGAGKDVAPDDDPDQRTPSERAAEASTATQGAPWDEVNPDDIPF